MATESCHRRLSKSQEAIQATCPHREFVTDPQSLGAPCSRRPGGCSRTAFQAGSRPTCVPRRPCSDARPTRIARSSSCFCSALFGLSDCRCLRILPVASRYEATEQCMLYPHNRCLWPLPRGSPPVPPLTLRTTQSQLGKACL